MNVRLRRFAAFLVLNILIFSGSAAGAEFPNFNLELAFFPTENGQPVAGGTAFTRSYTFSGPVGGGSLLPGMRLTQGPGRLYGVNGQAVYQYDPATRTLQPMDASALIPPVSWPMGIAHDTRLGRMVMVSLGGEGILYNFIVPDPTNAPANGLWTFLGSMDNKDVDSIAYLPSLDTFFAVGFSYGPGMPAKIFRIAPDGTHLGEIPLPELPYDISLTGYDAELAAYGDYLALFLEPRAGNNPAVRESRIYLVNPVTWEVHLTYQRAISDETPDTTAPAVQMRTPTNGTNVMVGVPIVLTASASDTGGVQRVEFHRNGAFLALGLLNPGSPNLFSFSWTTAPAGTNQVFARAVDNAGNIGSSAPINIIVTTNPPANTNQPDTTPPVVEMRTPANGARIQQGQPIVLSARAVDARSEIALVEFLRNGTAVARGSNSRAEPSIYSISWSNAPLGTNILAARAIDSLGNMGTSAPISIVVVSNSVPVPTNRPPVVRLTFPEPNATFPLGAIRLSASASDPDGSIATVEFFVDGQSVGTRTPTNGVTTFFVEWTPPTNGTYEVFARGTDNEGRSANSATVRFRVGERPPQNERISAERSLPDEFRPGKPFEVKIEVEAGRNVESWSVADEPPAGWRVVGISHGGKFDAETGTVKFGPFNKNDRTLRYHVIPPKTNVLGTFHFTGEITADGVVSAITGDDEIEADRSANKVKIRKDKHGKVVLQIDPEDVRRWIVEFRDSFTRGNWIALPDATVTIDANGELTIDDPTETRGQRFYRLRAVDED